MSEAHSDQIKQAASDQSEAAQYLPATIEEELKKLTHFTGTIEIPLPAAEEEGSQASSDVPSSAETEKETAPNNDFNDFEDLLWGGNLPSDAPLINYGDEYVVTEGEPLADGKEPATVDEITQAIKTVEDPELMMNVYDLGLIYRLDRLANGDVEIDMTVTAPSCPVAGVMPKQVAEAVAKLDGVGKVTVKLVWEPAWTMDRISEEAKYALDIF
ncbi:MAG: DUF59 domain-containing protein [Alphaproteobacteria bacterium]|nr:DUF59 domain-containing protein [Alphaproteobacteria bacterium]